MNLYQAGKQGGHTTPPSLLSVAFPLGTSTSACILADNGAPATSFLSQPSSAMIGLPIVYLSNPMITQPSSAHTRACQKRSCIVTLSATTIARNDQISRT